MQLLKSRWIDDIKNEVKWVFVNGATCGKDEQVEYFVRNGVISFFMRVINEDDKYTEIFDVLEDILVFIVFFRFHCLACWRSTGEVAWNEESLCSANRNTEYKEDE